MIRRSLFAVAAALVLGLGPTVSAHHGWAGYQTTEFNLEGTVVRDVTSDGAHSSMQIRVGTQVWDLTLAPPAATTRAGLKSGIIPVGATVTINGHRHVDPKRFEVKTERVTWNGKTFNVYPGRT
jgi:Family of unknown function (DUF6152)